MVKEVKNKPGLFYLYIHSMLAQHSINFTIKHKEAVSYLSEWRIPKHLRIAILKELESYRLIEKQSGKGRLLKINRNCMDCSKVNDMYRYVRLL